MAPDSVLFKPLSIIKSDLGSVRHGIRLDDEGYEGFGEVYFSTVNQNCIKGWKKHLRMTMNLVVCSGCVQVAVLGEKDLEKPDLFTLSCSKNYGRLTIPSNHWVAFKGIEGNNVIMNFANLLHDPAESINESYGSNLFPKVF